MIEKKIFNFEIPENIVLKVKGLEIEVKPFLSLAEQIELINSYIDGYFSPDKNSIQKDEYGLFDIEYSTRLMILGLCTNIEIVGAFENLFYDSEIWNEVKESILNYYDFLDLLEQTIKNIKEQRLAKNSLASLVEKVGVMLNSLAEDLKDLNPENLEKLKEVGKDLISKINESPIAKEVFSDAERGK